MNMQKMRIRPALLSQLNGMNEKENSFLRKAVQSDDWIKENIEGIYSDDNLYLIDMGETENDMKIVTKIESFKVLVRYLSLLEKMDKLSKEYVDDPNNEKDIYEIFQDFDTDFIDQCKDLISNEPAGDYE